MLCDISELMLFSVNKLVIYVVYFNEDIYLVKLIRFHEHGNYSSHY